MNIIITGPTASGKTEVALNLAKIIGGEIISADSRQVYKELTVGTAKPEGEYVNGVYSVHGVPYRMVDFVEVDTQYNTGLFARDAAVAQREVEALGKTAIFAGGTGMYLQSYFGGMDKLPEADPWIREKFNAIAAEGGKPRLHQMLSEVDPASAAAIPPGNIHRVMRALEIFTLTGTPASQLRTGKFAPNLGDNFTVYINWDREVLNKRIEARTHDMFDGWVKETAALLERGATRETPALKSLGYAQIIDYIEGNLTAPAAIERIVVLTRQYAKRQKTWFMRYKDMLILDGKTISADDLAQRFSDYKKSKL